MNPNQFKFNLNTMKSTKQDYETQGIKYYNFLLDLKHELDNKKNVNITNFCRLHTVSGLFSPFLIKNNVIFKDTNEDYIWNNKIPVSSALILKFRSYVSQKNKILRSKKNNKIYNTDSKVVKNKPKLIKQRTKVHNIGKEETKVIYSVQKQEIGLIRKFLKWIY